jgi:periplasmic protein TonB
MTEKESPAEALFLPSGCLTAGALMKYVSGSLSPENRASAGRHLASCPLCSDSAEGLTLFLNDPGSADPEPHKQASHHPAGAVSHAANGNQTTHDVPDRFFARTELINERIRNHPHAHAHRNAEREKYQPVKLHTWLAVAASVALLFALVYLITLQTVKDQSVLAMKENPGAKAPPMPDTLTVQAPQPSAPEAGKTRSAGEDAVKPKGVVQKKEVPQPAGVSGVPSGKRVAVSAPASTEETAISLNEEAQQPEEAVLTVVEEMPSFPGGNEKLRNFLQRNLKYPVQAAESGVQGKVMVGFTVGRDGSLSDIKVLRGIGGGCDEEALRVIRSMPRWLPGTQAGKKVDVRFTLPVEFKLTP